MCMEPKLCPLPDTFSQQHFLLSPKTYSPSHPKSGPEEHQTAYDCTVSTTSTLSSSVRFSFHLLFSLPSLSPSLSPCLSSFSCLSFLSFPLNASHATIPLSENNRATIIHRTPLSCVFSFSFYQHYSIVNTSRNAVPLSTPTILKFHIQHQYHSTVNVSYATIPVSSPAMLLFRRQHHHAVIPCRHQHQPFCLFTLGASHAPIPLSTSIVPTVLVQHQPCCYFTINTNHTKIPVNTTILKFLSTPAMPNIPLSTSIMSAPSILPFPLSTPTVQPSHRQRQPCYHPTANTISPFPSQRHATILPYHHQPPTPSKLTSTPTIPFSTPALPSRPLAATERPAWTISPLSVARHDRSYKVLKIAVIRGGSTPAPSVSAKLGFHKRLRDNFH
ncbi:hypothetical protein C7M84_001835 [Penaeus vannamei]|uniref:Uncharacterized protein n=1 Tax=Penaeus vannamei TaxID=6689 RepID=A0A423TSS0_PENVA|nr:hypothetical protein C7M84_001835 [Penaeus vannamei]